MIFLVFLLLERKMLVLNCSKTFEMYKPFHNDQSFNFFSFGQVFLHEIFRLFFQASPTPVKSFAGMFLILNLKPLIKALFK